MTDEPTIYVQGEYAKGKLISKNYVLDKNDRFVGHRKNYPSLQKLAVAFTRTAFGNYANLSSEEIDIDEDNVIVKRPLSIRELEWLALNATKDNKERLKNQRNLRRL